MSFDPNAAAKALLQGAIAQCRPFQEITTVTGKAAIVTGGTSGLGFNIVLRLLQGGANVVAASYAANEAEYALPLLAEQGFGDDRVKFFKCDVSSEDQVEALVAFTAEQFGSVDILVNSAAIWSYAHIYDLSADTWRRTIEVNLTGSFLMLKHVSRYMVDNGVKGKICMISSDSADLPYPLFGGYPHYVASKGGVNGLVLEAAKELKRYGIMVNGVAPGGMVTSGSSMSLCDPNLDEDKADEFYEELMAWSVDGQQTTDSVATMAYVMCTPMADGTTGEVFRVDAGMRHNIFSFLPEMERFPEEED